LGAEPPFKKEAKVNRVPYRRVTPPRNGSLAEHDCSHKNEKITTRETILVQAIISGLLLTVVLLICLVDIAPMVTLQDGLRQVLSGPTTMQELSSEIEQFRTGQLTHIIEPAEEMPPPSTIPVLPVGWSETSLPYRTATEEPINPQSPGPSVVPGLWD